MTVRNDRESAEFTLLSTYFLFSGQIIYTDEKLPPDVPTHNILQHCVNLSQGRCPAPDWKRPPGRPRKTWIQQVDHWCTIDSLWSSAQDRSLWRSLRPSLVRRSSEWVKLKWKKSLDEGNCIFILYYKSHVKRALWKIPITNCKLKLYTGWQMNAWNSQVYIEAMYKTTHCF